MGDETKGCDTTPDQELEAFEIEVFRQQELRAYFPATRPLEEDAKGSQNRHRTCKDK